MPAYRTIDGFPPAIQKQIADKLAKQGQFCAVTASVPTERPARTEAPAATEPCEKSTVPVAKPAATTTETAMQTQIVVFLERAGYVVLQIGGARRQTRCPHCSKWHTVQGYVGNTPGTPDLAIRHPQWRRAMWLLIEMKTIDGDAKPAQVELAVGGHTFIARSLEQVVALVEAVKGD